MLIIDSGLLFWANLYIVLFLVCIISGDIHHVIVRHTVRS